MQAVTCAVDLGLPDNCRDSVATAVRAFSRLDALCNVAAVFIPCHAADMSPGDWDKTLAVNLSAPFRLIQEAIPHLLVTHGAVVNVTSRGYHGACISIDNGITAG